MKMLYHVTFQSNLENIAASGLTPNFDKETNFDGYPVDGKLFVTTTLQSAQFYLENLKNLRDDDPTVILRFSPKNIHLEPDPFGNPNDRRTSQSIAGDRIEALQEGEWLVLAKLHSRSVSEHESKSIDATTIGEFTVFIEDAIITVTTDGKPLCNKTLENLAMKFSVDHDRHITDMALPASTTLESVFTIAKALRLEFSGRALAKIKTRENETPSVPGMIP